MEKKFLALLCLCACGCMSIGHPIDSAKLTQIKRGKTTRAEVLALLGKPDSMHRMESEFFQLETWTYSFIHGSVKPETFVPIVGAFAGGARWQTRTVSIRFKDGVVDMISDAAAASEASRDLAAEPYDDESPVGGRKATPRQGVKPIY